MLPHKNQFPICFSVFLLSILGGILLGNALGYMILSLIIASFFLLLAFYICLFYRHIFLYAIISGCAACIGIYSSLYQQGVIEYNFSQIENYTNVYIEYSGKVQGLHARNDYDDEYIVSLHSVGSTTIDGDIRHILRLPKNFSLTPGDNIVYSGKMYLIEDFDGFSYKKYMLSKSIYFSTSSNSVDVIDNTYSRILMGIYSFRQNLLARIQKIFPEKEAIFLSGILFGARENIPGDLKEDFNNSGLTHFIAVSGFNITICIIFLSAICMFLPLWIRYIIVSISIIMFSLFVGGGAPVIRASIMGILGYIFLGSGNKVLHIPLLAFTATSMTIMSPLSLSYDVSLHLSFLAVIGIIYTQDIFQKIFSFVPNILAVREALVLTFAALTFSLPIMVFQFGQVSLLAPIANIAVTWTIPLAMLTGTLTLIMDFINPIFGETFGYVSWTLLKFDMLMVHFFGNIEGALLRIETGAMSIYLQVLYFIFLTYFLCLYQIKRKIK